jgi:hypothetical protein
MNHGCQPPALFSFASQTDNSSRPCKDFWSRRHRYRLTNLTFHTRQTSSPSCKPIQPAITSTPKPSEATNVVRDKALHNVRARLPLLRARVFVPHGRTRQHHKPTLTCAQNLSSQQRIVARVSWPVLRTTRLPDRELLFLGPYYHDTFVSRSHGRTQSLRPVPRPRYLSILRPAGE